MLEFSILEKITFTFKFFKYDEKIIKEVFFFPQIEQTNIWLPFTNHGRKSAFSLISLSWKLNPQTSSLKNKTLNILILKNYFFKRINIFNTIL